MVDSLNHRLPTARGDGCHLSLEGLEWREPSQGLAGPVDRVRESLCSSINHLTSLARTRRMPVVWVRQEFEPDLSDAFLDMKSEHIRMFIKGTHGPLVPDELLRDESDIEVVKKRYSMFHGTALESLLAQLVTHSLILAGVNSHACIRMAAIDAYQRDFSVSIVRECVASKDARHHEITMEYLGGGIARLVTLAELQRQFDAENAASQAMPPQ